jgi:hypothetical protein
MSEPLVNLESMEDVSTNSGKKVSAFDSILDSFLISNEPMFEVDSNGEDVGVFEDQLRTKIRERYIDDIVETVIIDDVLYLKK